MPKTYLVSVGTSLFTNLSKEKPDGEMVENDLGISLPNDGSLSDLWGKPVTAWGSHISRFYKRGNEPGPGLWALNHWGQITRASKEWFKQTAEIASLAKVGLRPEDRVILLASSTCKGVFSALVNAYLIASPGQPPQIRRKDWKDPTASWERIQVDWGEDCEKSFRPLNQLTNSPVQVVPVKGLNPTQKETFEEDGVYQLMRSLVYLMVEALEEGRELEILFTGGFKASVPVITQTVIWAAGCWSYPLRMQALFEESEDLVATPILGSVPPIEAVRAVLAVRRRDEADYRHADLGRYCRYKTQEKSCLAEVDTPLKPLLKDDPSGRSPRVALNVLGNALLAVVEELLAGDRGSSWRENIMGANQ